MPFFGLDGTFWHFDAGNLITLASMLAGLYAFHMTNVKRITRMEFKINLMWRRFAKRFDMNEDLGDDRLDNGH